MQSSQNPSPMRTHTEETVSSAIIKLEPGGMKNSVTDETIPPMETINEVIIQNSCPEVDAPTVILAPSNSSHLVHDSLDRAVGCSRSKAETLPLTETSSHVTAINCRNDGLQNSGSTHFSSQGRMDSSADKSVKTEPQELDSTANSRSLECSGTVQRELQHFSNSEQNDTLTSESYANAVVKTEPKEFSSTTFDNSSGFKRNETASEEPEHIVSNLPNSEQNDALPPELSIKNRACVVVLSQTPEYDLTSLMFNRQESDIEAIPDYISSPVKFESFSGAFGVRSPDDNSDQNCELRGLNKENKNIGLHVHDASRKCISECLLPSNSWINEETDSKQDVSISTMQESSKGGQNEPDDLCLNPSNFTKRYQCSNSCSSMKSGANVRGSADGASPLGNSQRSMEESQKEPEDNHANDTSTSEGSMQQNDTLVANSENLTSSNTEIGAQCTIAYFQESDKFRATVSSQNDTHLGIGEICESGALVETIPLQRDAHLQSGESDANIGDINVEAKIATAHECRRRATEEDCNKLHGVPQGTIIVPVVEPERERNTKHPPESLIRTLETMKKRKNILNEVKGESIQKTPRKRKPAKPSKSIEYCNTESLNINNLLSDKATTFPEMEQATTKEINVDKPDEDFNWTRHWQFMRTFKRYECNGCGRLFSTSSAMNRHIRRIHLNRPFFCKECNTNFNVNGAYQEHMNLYHPELHEETEKAELSPNREVYSSYSTGSSPCKNIQYSDDHLGSRKTSANIGHINLESVITTSHECRRKATGEDSSKLHGVPQDTMIGPVVECERERNAKHPPKSLKRTLETMKKRKNILNEVEGESTKKSRRKRKPSKPSKSIEYCNIEPVNINSHPSNKATAFPQMEQATTKETNVDIPDEGFSLNGHRQMMRNFKHYAYGACCGRLFSTSSGLNRHIRRIHPNRPFFCRECNTGFTVNGAYQEHMNLCHPGLHQETKTVELSPNLEPSSSASTKSSPCNDTNFKCSFCPKVFQQKAGLACHISSAHPEKVSHQKPFWCSECNKGFTQNHSYKAHLRIHTGERPYMCQECGAAFVDNKTLQNHKALHSKEKTFKCTLCPKMFRQRAGLACHMKTHTNEKPFGCEICGQFFKTKSTLINHQRIHSEEKPYQCHVCSQSFKQRAGLSCHSKVHEKG